ncbi:hypothetical protein B9479_005284 [Cryptococcus floricola]|uniref:MARVEL domain-containing protein n=1 Tax=Cryptococcus floricola TaxID=2591691 RepID=A0A5D3ATS4_9TREE|nr:hypothetical protein B9479_005284 [Cryptococcus floricola]
MDRIKSAISSSSAGAKKLSKAFRPKTDHSALGGGSRFGMGNPFADNADREDTSLPRLHLIIHGVALFFTLLAVCTIAAVAGFQGKWFGVTGGTGFTLFLVLLSFFLSATLLGIPLIYDRWDKLRRSAQFLSHTRSLLILHAFGTFLMLMAAFIVTISAWTAKGCKNADDDPHEDLGDDYKNGLASWCRTKKASAIFDWFSFAAWAALLVLTGLAFRKEQRNNRRDPSFLPPETNGISYSNIVPEEERYGDKPDSYPIQGTMPTTRNDSRREEQPYDPTTNYGYSQPSRPATQQQLGRPSVDAYGAFDGDGMPGGEQPSRTMQMASYSDPYAQIRSSLQTGQGASQPAYSIPPGPPSYAGYRQH